MAQGSPKRGRTDRQPFEWPECTIGSEAPEHIRTTGIATDGPMYAACLGVDTPNSLAQDQLWRGRDPMYIGTCEMSRQPMYITGLHTLACSAQGELSESSHVTEGPLSKPGRAAGGASESPPREPRVRLSYIGPPDRAGAHGQPHRHQAVGSRESLHGARVQAISRSMRSLAEQSDPEVVGFGEWAARLEEEKDPEGIREDESRGFARHLPDNSQLHAPSGLALRPPWRTSQHADFFAMMERPQPSGPSRGTRRSAPRMHTAAGQNDSEVVGSGEEAWLEDEEDPEGIGEEESRPRVWGFAQHLPDSGQSHAPSGLAFRPPWEWPPASGAPFGPWGPSPVPAPAWGSADLLARAIARRLDAQRSHEGTSTPLVPAAAHANASAAWSRASARAAGGRQAWDAPGGGGGSAGAAGTSVPLVPAAAHANASAAPSCANARAARGRVAWYHAPERGGGSAGATGAASSSGGAATAPPPSPPPTTLMLKSMPTCYTRDMLVALLDQEGFRGEYDFVYMPMKFGNSMSFGYAFVNLTSVDAADRCMRRFHGFSSWEVSNNTVCQVSKDCVHNGREANIMLYRNSSVMHELVPDICKPALFANGERVPFPRRTKYIRPPRCPVARVKFDDGT